MMTICVNEVLTCREILGVEVKLVKIKGETALFESNSGVQVEVKLDYSNAPIPKQREKLDHLRYIPQTRT